MLLFPGADSLRPLWQKTYRQDNFLVTLLDCLFLYINRRHWVVKKCLQHLPSPKLWCLCIVVFSKHMTALDATCSLHNQVHSTNICKPALLIATHVHCGFLLKGHMSVEHTQMFLSPSASANCLWGWHHRNSPTALCTDIGSAGTCSKSTIKVRVAHWDVPFNIGLHCRLQLFWTNIGVRLHTRCWQLRFLNSTFLDILMRKPLSIRKLLHNVCWTYEK